MPAITELGGRYHLLRELGAGGMAVVYLAEDRLLGRTVAVKVLRDEYTLDEEFIARFQQEARAAAGLTHPNIVTVHDVGQEGNVYYIVMEYVEGESLKELLRKEGPLPVDVALALTLQACQGLAYAHSKGIVHRDIKPQNLLIAPAAGVTPAERRVKLADFGIAKALGVASFSKAGEVMGSVHYLAPEQARGEEVSPATDLYALGVVLYEMLGGRPPFEGETALSVALKHLQDEPLPLPQLNPRVPAPLWAVVGRLLAKNPTQRFASAGALALALTELSRLSQAATGPLRFSPREEALASVPIAASAQAPARPPSRRAPGLLLGLSLLTVLWIASGLYLLAVTFGPTLLRRVTLFPEAANIQVPPLVRLDALQAQQLLDSLGLRYREEGLEFNEGIPAGAVLQQRPEAGTVLEPGGMVTVIISRGPPPITVPSLKGLPYDQARQQLNALGLRSVKDDDWHDSVGPGLVFEQRPGPGERLPRGGTVTLVVSLGKPTPQPGAHSVMVPQVVGKREVEAKAAIEQVRLRIFPYVNYQGHDQLPDDVLRTVCVGCVLSTTPSGGTFVDPFTEIKIAVRKD